jgi:hypothetical protein
MKRLNLFFMVLLMVWGCAAIVKAEDVVYLKDGSEIHGTIIEEVPGVSIKIQTNDGNTFVYKTRLIAKITHSASDQSNASGDNSGDTTVVVKHNGPGNLSNVFQSDPNANFSEFSFFGGVGVATMGTINTFNDDVITPDFGSDYDLSPLVYSGNFGLGWFTNHIGLKWNFTYGVNVSSYNDGYTYSNDTDFYVYEYGSELELDLSLDDVQTCKTRPNARRVMSVYLPLIVGYWDVSVEDNYSSIVYTGTCTDFGSGLGIRAMGDDHLLVDLQFIYRYATGNALEYNEQANTRIPISSTKYLDADVTGFAMNCDIGFTFN